ncbi:aromatic ring-hydroxylating dioxygenase subunit alpha [Variovorax sp. J22R133]|uniref:aromatic ring-hydroxylating oxygenase subunit alpha n=1 Tax=Variovorax brevis TaxID=3053503 RepID=UPI00257741FC|nr:aromatic ring-hydroxylating dioxygenase subunit alpha [Variovorax sp. J22R133]MDM0115256.1 aromatic ring-hydroxylating dioxygenase subunit alpha [Variovorax sp. J22R133]
MLSRLTPAHYLSQAIFDLERERIFRKLWLFAAFRTSLAEPGAFVTRTMAGLPVLLQNCGGDIRAFENLCPHRQMPLQREAFGQARMVCPYHGWVFDDEGKVKSIPHEETLYAYPAEERERLCLRRYAVAVIGNLVFINFDVSPMSVDDQFTRGFQAALAEASSHFASQAVHVNIPVRYNWKFNYENVLDGNHVPYVHPKSFQPLLREGATAHKQLSPTTAPASRNALPAGESIALSKLQAQSCLESTPFRVESWPWHESVERYGDGDLFHTFSIFPNVNFISPGGLTFIAQQFEPVAPGQTELRMTLTLAREKRRMPGLPALLRTYLKGEAAVVNEDIAYLEALQSHLHLGAPRAQQGRYEASLRSAADAYLDLLGPEGCL